MQPNEREELKNTGNFGGGVGWFSGKVRNIPPVNSVTPVNSFESDVQEITPIDNSQIDNLPDTNK